MSAQLTAPAEALAAAREAWRIKTDAEATLSRLRKYRGMTEGMKLDRTKALARLAEAEAVLRSVLGAAA